MFEPKDDVPDFKSVLEVSLVPVFILPADDWPAFDSVVIALVCEVTDLDVLELSDFGGATTVEWPVASCLAMLLLVFGSVFGLVGQSLLGFRLDIFFCWLRCLLWLFFALYHSFKLSRLLWQCFLQDPLCRHLLKFWSFGNFLVALVQKGVRDPDGLSIQCTCLFC